MKGKNDMKRLTTHLLVILILAACSTTKHLPEGEILYTGQKPVIIENRSGTRVEETALEEVEVALAKAPNNSLLNSSTVRIPFPVGLWIYTGFAKYRKGFGRWIFNRFASTPVLMSSVNPEIRRKAAGNLLRDYGYFNGTVSYRTFVDPKDSLKAKLQYTVDMRNPYYIDTLDYRGFSARTQRIMDLARSRSLIRRGRQFNVGDLDGERNRIGTLLRNVGCYYFRPDYLTYRADTTRAPGGRVSMRMVPVPGMPAVAEKPFYVGRRSVYLLGRQGQQPNDSLDYKGLRIHYHHKPGVRPGMLYRWVNYEGYHRKRQVQDSTGISRRRAFRDLYSLYRQTRVQERLANVGIFRYVEMRYTPRDTTFVSDTLDLNIHLAPDKPYDAELDFNVKMKSNNQMGPGASFKATKNNVFGGGESWNVKVNGSYEWQTGKDRSSLLNSYEIGVSTALSLPRVVFPRMGDREYDFPATTTFKLYASQLSRAKYYKLLAFGGNVTYEFRPHPVSKHSVTPFRLTFNVLRDPTRPFEELQKENPALYVSLRDQFIPAMEYTYTYDNASLPGKRNPVWWQATVASAGNITAALYRIFGKPFGEREKVLLGVPFAQFLKLNTELRYRYRIDRNQGIAARVAAGVVWSYGNMQAAPYTEQFYVGGANSVRAFNVRSMGPGGYPPDAENRFSFINHVGDIRMEANVEYRFRLLGNLHGAIFLDAGNVWLLRKETARPQGEFSLENFPRQVALGTGAGLRYDLDFLVFRIDWGVALHYPYETGKKGYYNIPSFGDSMALHFAIGYPF